MCLCGLLVRVSSRNFLRTCNDYACSYSNRINVSPGFSAELVMKPAFSIVTVKVIVFYTWVGVQLHLALKLNSTGHILRMPSPWQNGWTGRVMWSTVCEGRGIFQRVTTTMALSLGCHLEKTLAVRQETYIALDTCLYPLTQRLREFESEPCLLIKLSETGAVVVAVQRCLETALDTIGILDSRFNDLQRTEEQITLWNAFKHERNEWMERIKLLLANDQRMKMEIGDENQSVEIMTRLKYGMERYGDVLTSEELHVMSDVFDTVVHRSNGVVVEIPKWFTASKHDWSVSSCKITRVCGTDDDVDVWDPPVRGTADQISHDVELWASLHHPHVRTFFGACHVGQNSFIVHENFFQVGEYEATPQWKLLLGCARGLEYVHGCGLAHRNLTCSDLLGSIDRRGILSGLGLVRQNNCRSTCTIKKEEQPSPERDVLAFGLCIFSLLTQQPTRAFGLSNSIQTAERLPARKPQHLEERKWDLLNRMCSSNAVDRIDIRDVIYTMELLLPDDLPGKHGTDTIEKIEVVEDLSQFMVNTLDLTLEATLTEVEQVCANLPNFSAVNQPVLSRLKDIFFQLQAATDPLPLEVVENYSLILIRFDKRLERRGFCVVVSACASRTLANKNYSIHRDLDRLIQSTPQLQADSSVHSWLSHFQKTEDLQRATLQGYMENSLPTLNELDSEDDRTEAATLLKFEARNHDDEFAAYIAPHLTSNELPKWFIPSYQVELGRHIAEGSFGSVYEGKWLGTDVVVKMVMSDQRNAENRRQFLREVDLWFSLSHKHLIKLYGACHVGQPFFVCERAMQGPIVDNLESYEPMRRNFRWGLIHDAALGLQHLHDHGIIHGDLKGNNILMDGGIVKLCDFGLASLSSSGQKQLTEMEIGALGAIRWKAPECLLGSGSTFASDIYSFGMCIIELLTGQYPWGALDDSTVKFNVTEQKLMPPRPKRLHEATWSLITQMCCFDPAHRIKIGSVVNVLVQLAYGRSPHIQVTRAGVCLAILTVGEDASAPLHKITINAAEGEGEPLEHPSLAVGTDQVRVLKELQAAGFKDVKMYRTTHTIVFDDPNGMIQANMNNPVITKFMERLTKEQLEKTLVDLVEKDAQANFYQEGAQLDSEDSFADGQPRLIPFIGFTILAHK